MEFMEVEMSRSDDALAQLAKAHSGISGLKDTRLIWTKYAACYQYYVCESIYGETNPNYPERVLT
jgi:hypothetical protein